MNKGQDMNQQKQKDFSGVQGFLTLVSKDTSTGEVVQYMSEKNIVTNSGVSKLVDNLTGAGNASLNRFVFGDDVGNGTELVPEVAKEGYDSSRQSELFVIPPSDIAISTTGGNTLLAETTISGSDLLTNFFPSSISLNLTSATFRFSDDTTFSYKRFSAMVVSRMVDIVVEWEIQFSNDCN